tara:strand:- start:31 stop:447 length:417 start_codon:yes stop_codon:yes gene_type:complete
MNNSSIFTEKLRSSGLRPTKQRIQICKILFDRKDTFHFTINDLNSYIKKTTSEVISLATVYNTINALKDKGYLKEIYINNQEAYFDTNVSNHHHFFDVNKKQLIDLSSEDVEQIKIKKSLPDKKIQSVELLIKVVSKK